MERLARGDLDDLRDYLRVQIAAGFEPLPAVIDGAVDIFADTTLVPDEVRIAATALADELVAAQVEDQSTWPPVTDNERLDSAFAALDASGIVARQNFRCCQSCGSNDIHAEMDDAAQTGVDVRGYTFFHLQDTEFAVDGEPLFLSFGAPDGSREAGEAIGREVVTVLQQHGLNPTWNGRLANRIGLPLVWQRRR